MKKQLNLLILILLIIGGCTPAPSGHVPEPPGYAEMTKNIEEHTGTFPPIKVGMKYADLLQQIKDLNHGEYLNVIRESHSEGVNFSLDQFKVYKGSYDIYEVWTVTVEDGIVVSFGSTFVDL